MNGNSTRIITTGDHELFQALAQLRVVDREQASEITGRRGVSVSTCNAWLLKLRKAGLLKRFFIATETGGIKALYSLTSASAALSGTPYHPIQRKADSVLVSDQFIQHQLAVNSLLIQLKYREIPVPGLRFESWMNFAGSISPDVPLTPDGYVELASPELIHSVFCEVDRGTESQKIWQKKTQLYIRLAASGEFERLFTKSRFRVLVVADSDRRLNHIRRTVASQTTKIFWFSTIQKINQQGLFAPHWLRPVGDNSQVLW